MKKKNVDALNRSLQVNALFDYRAASNEEFSFAQGDVIAVTATDVSFFTVNPSLSSSLLKQRQSTERGSDFWFLIREISRTGGGKG